MTRARLHLPLAMLVAAGSLAASGVGRIPAAAAPTTAADAATDVKDAGPDFEIQGEYQGKAGDQKLGAQVIALGDGSFQAVFLPGGLPGDGWDGKTRVRVDGKTVGELTSFEMAGSEWKGRIEAGVLAGERDGGLKFRLGKVIRTSPTAGQKPPAGANVLFDGSNADAWINGAVTPDGLLQPGGRTKGSFQDFTLHAEFRTPFKPLARGQSRGNSGVYIFGRYEVQILDSFGLEGRDNECGGLYRQKAPDVNMCYPPLAWQTYDVDFQAPRFENEQKVKNAVITVRHNGVVIHNNVELPGPTGGGKRAGETAAPGPINIQNHGNPVHLRNIWLVEKK